MNSKTISILVCDDDSRSADTIGKVLAQAGFDAQIVTALPTLFEIVKVRPIQVLVVSRLLATSSGLEVMQRVRELSPSTAIVLLSNRSEPFSMETGRPEVVLERPFSSLHAIEEAVREAIDFRSKTLSTRLSDRVSEVVNEAFEVLVSRRKS